MFLYNLELRTDHVLHQHVCAKTTLLLLFIIIIYVKM